MQLVIVRVDELDEETGRLLSKARATIVTRAEAAGAKITAAPAPPPGSDESRPGALAFEVDLAQAAEIEQPGRWWVLATADGQLTGQPAFEVK